MGYDPDEDIIDQIVRRESRPPPEVPAGTLPQGPDPSAVRGRTPSPYVRQVNVKLDVERFEMLGALAELFGVSTSGMARMIVHRAVLDARERDEI